MNNRRKSQKFSQVVTTWFNEHSDGLEIKKYQSRTQHVYKMWEQVVEPYFLDHTNAVFVLKKEESDKKELIVYVDDSSVCAELEARKELLKIKFLKECGEDIDSCKVIVSREKFKKNYPYKKQVEGLHQPLIPVDLTPEQITKFNRLLMQVENPRLQGILAKAIETDLRYKNALGNKKDKK